MGHYGTPTPALEATTTIFININIIGNIYIKINIDKNTTSFSLQGILENLLLSIFIVIFIYLSPPSIVSICLVTIEVLVIVLVTTIKIIPIFL